MNPRRAHRDHHADLQRGRGHRVRRPARHLRVGGRHRPCARSSTSSCCPTATTRRSPRPSAPPGKSCAPRWPPARTSRRSRSTTACARAAPHRKAGNVADFCRRWGKDYRYMVVLDADSVMSGDCLVVHGQADGSQPAAPASSRPRTQAIGHVTLHARAQQFASRVTGPPVHARHAVLAARRVALLGPQRDHPRRALHGALRAGAASRARGGMSGGILSHDFVEAALMRRAGYHVWLVADLVGQLRAAAAGPAGRTAARPPLVPGQPAERAPDRRAGPAPGAPRDVRHRRHVLPVGAAVAGAS